MNKQKKTSANNEYEDIVNFSFDCSKLIVMLKQDKELIKGNMEEIIMLKKTIKEMQKNNEVVKNSINDLIGKENESEVYFGTMNS